MRDVLRLIAQTLPPWPLPPWPSLWRCALTGVLGIASGFAVFLLSLDEIIPDPWHFFAAFGVAVLVAFAFESLKEDVEEKHPHHWQLPRLIALMVLVILAEIFIMGFHSTAELVLEGVNHTLDVFLANETARWHAVGFIGVWLVLGGAIAVGLGTTIFDTRCEIPEGETPSWGRPGVWGLPTLCAALRGGFAGAVAGPACMLLYIFVVRFVFEYLLIVGGPERWRRHLQGAAQAMSEPGWTWLIWVPIQAIRLLEETFKVFGDFGPLFTLATLVALLVLCARFRAVRTFFVLLAAVLVVYVYPLAAESTQALRLAGLMAYVWAVPSFLLGALTPWLKRPAGYPKLWGMVAFAAAGILVVASLAFPLCIVLAALLGAAGVAVRRSVEADKYWAVLALSVATNVFGATHIATQADFFNIQKDAFSVAKAEPRFFEYRPPFGPLPDPKVLAKYLDEQQRRMLSDPSLPTIAIQTDLSAVRGERGRTAQLEADLAKQVKDLAAVKGAVAKRLEVETTTPQHREYDARLEELEVLKTTVAEKQRALPKPPHREYYERLAELEVLSGLVAEKEDAFLKPTKPKYYDRLKRMTELDARTAATLTELTKLAEQIAAARDQESNRAIPGRAAYPGQPSPISRSLHETLRAEQALLQGERQKLLATLQQVQQAEKDLTGVLKELQVVVKPLADDFNLKMLQAFEVSLTAASGFWITLGLLASWRIRRDQAAGRHRRPHSPED